MAAEDHRVSRATDGVAIGLLRRLRAGAEIPFVHHVDVCSARPADLVANLQPAPGTDGIWYFFYPKMYKNTQGNTIGHRQREIVDTGGETWHSEVRKNVRGSEGGTYCNLSYGRNKDDGSFERMGWSMVEYDFVDKQATSTAASNHVLSKVYRPCHGGKGKPSSSSKSATSSSSKSAATNSSSAKRKARSGNPEARPAKLTKIQREQVQMQMQHDNSFTNYNALAPEHDGEFVQTEYGLLPSQVAHINIDEWIGCQEMLGAEGDQGLQQQTSAEKEQADELICIPVPMVDAFTVEDLLGPCPSSKCVSPPTATGCTPLDDDFFVGVHLECPFGAQEKVSSSHTPSSSTCPMAPVLKEVTFEDLFGPEMMSGEFVSTPAASTFQDASSRASSSQFPSWSTAPSSPARCSRLVQEPPLGLSYLLCS